MSNIFSHELDYAKTVVKNGFGVNLNINNVS